MDPSFEDVLKHYKQLTSRSLLCFQEFYPTCAPETIGVAITDSIWVEGRRKLNLCKEYRSGIGEARGDNAWKITGSFV